MFFYFKINNYQKNDYDLMVMDLVFKKLNVVERNAEIILIKMLLMDIIF